MTTTPQPPRIAWSPREFGQMTGISEWAIRDLCRSGDIPATKFGQQWRIADSYVQAVQAGTVRLPAA